MSAVALIPARHKNVNRAEVCDQNFVEYVQNWSGMPRRAPRADEAVLPGSLCTAHDFIELFESQLISRHLDLMARVLRVKNKVFYTIGSSGHEGNAAVAAAASTAAATPSRDQAERLRMSVLPRQVRATCGCRAAAG